jgi:hypothetical protein
MIAISVLMVAVSACTNDEADREHCGGAGASCPTTTVGSTTSSTTAAASTVPGSTSPVAESSTSVATSAVPPSTTIAGQNEVITETIKSIKFIDTGSPVKICSDVVTKAVGNSPWHGIVLKDETVDATTKVRWLFCYGEGGSGEGVEALWSTNSRDWRFMRLGFGEVFHAGDAPAAVVFDDMRAAVSYDTMIGEGHNYAYTRDGGETWTRMKLPPYPTPAP